MKKMFLGITAAALLVGIGSSWTYDKYFSEKESSKHYALSKTYKSTDELVKNSKLIIKGEVSKEFELENVGELLYRVYTVQVDKVYSNDFNTKITQGETIDFYRPVGLRVGKDIAYITDEDKLDIDGGDYLLFLNGGYVESIDKEILVPNTPNQLYKLNDSKGLIGYENYEGVFKSEKGLNEITEEELLKTINNQ
ncbi:hypothetical protein EEL30_00165 (plasmid) [Brevibacillus laterosporus]|uniref:Uncharacterized protein n=1 Tax=Brevibacillus laterosporus TaxID=1465 RepID=A0A518V1R3_BRELA|nr:hypothetical protein EEL30_00165 [Brevibacillus laterosporus]